MDFDFDEFEQYGEDYDEEEEEIDEVKIDYKNNIYIVLITLGICLYRKRLFNSSRKLHAVSML